MVSPGTITAIMVPFEELLKQYLQKAQELGRNPMRCDAKCETDIQEGVNILYCSWLLKARIPRPFASKKNELNINIGYD